MRKLPTTAAEDLLELIMRRRYEQASTLMTARRLGQAARRRRCRRCDARRLLHHAHVLRCGPRSWRTRTDSNLKPEEPTE